MDTLLILALTGVVLVVVGCGNRILDFIAYRLCDEPMDSKMLGRIEL